MSGRPSTYTVDLAAQICGRLAEGETLRQICRDEEMPGQRTVFSWLLQHDEFRQQYAHAREAQADAWADEILDIADDGSNDWMKRDGRDVVDGEHIQRSRLRVDARKWLMGKAAPKKYGEKIEHEVSGKDGGAIPTSLTVTFLKPGQMPDEG